MKHRITFLNVAIFVLGIMVGASVMSFVHFATGIHSRNILFRGIVSEVDSIIPDGCGLDPEYVVRTCLENDFDITLFLAQAKHESNFGKRGAAVRTHSLCGVGAYDNGKLKYYDSPNDCLLPYIRIMKRDYLDGGKKSVDVLLTRFVNRKGKRYASDPEYEIKIRRARNEILSGSHIYNMQKEYNLTKELW